jgi:hypothetical protein
MVSLGWFRIIRSYGEFDRPRWRRYHLFYGLPALVVSIWAVWHVRGTDKLNRHARTLEAEILIVEAELRIRASEAETVRQIQHTLTLLVVAEEMHQERFAAMAMSPADPPAGCTADVNGDGLQDIDDILAVMAAFSLETCEPPCPADICCCGPHVVDVEDLIAVLFAFTGATDICPVVECPLSSARIEIRCRNADGEMVLMVPDADGSITVMEEQYCEYTAAGFQESDNE